MIIYKYQLVPYTDTTLQLPRSARILKFAEQFGNFCIWVQVDLKQEHINRKFRIFATGQEFNGDKWMFVGTLLQGQGNFVWHLYEEVTHE